MQYTQSFSFGKSKVGIAADLRLQLLDDSFSQLSIVTTGFHEAGLGQYWFSGNISSSTVAVKAYSINDATILNSDVIVAATGSSDGFTGSSEVNLRFEDADNELVTGVVFTVVGVGSAINATGETTVNLNDGTYTLRLAPTSGIIFEEQELVVDGTTDLTVTGTVVTIPSSSDPAQTNAYGIVRNAVGDILANKTIEFKLTTPASDDDIWDRTIVTAQSDSTGLVQKELMKSSHYQYRYSGGEWSVAFKTGTGSTYQLPRLLA